MLISMRHGHAVYEHDSVPTENNVANTSYIKQILWDILFFGSTWIHSGRQSPKSFSFPIVYISCSNVHLSATVAVAM